MASSRPLVQDREPVGPQMLVGVMVSAQTTGGLTPQALRLLTGLLDNPAFAVRVFAAPAPAPEVVSASVRAVLAIEARVIPPPQRTVLPILPDLTIEPAAAARSAALQVIVDLGGGAVDKGLAAGAVHGLWRVVAAPLTDAIAGATSTMAVLMLHGGDADRVIARAIYDTKPLATHNVAYVTEKSAQMILRELKRCAFDGKPADLGPADAVGSAAAAVPGAFGYLRGRVRKALPRIGQWVAQRRGLILRGFSLRLGRGSASDFDPGTALPVPMPQVALWADPFLLAHEGEIYCFFEDYDPVVGRGHISMGRVTKAGLADVQVALKRPHHMSYPFVFHHEGALLMMPEMYESGRLEIWRCTEFPSTWVPYATAFEGTPVADSVLHQKDGVWWLFTHISHDSFGDFSSDLHVFRVDGPQLTGLVPHRLNPVVTDSSTARGGGRIHQADGRLLRFSQDNSRGSYGGALNVMEIVQLDLDHYEERRVRHIKPDFAPDLMGCHHFDVVDGCFVIDVRHT